MNNGRMAGKRVVVDLSAYFQDHRQKSLLYIDHGSIKSVQHLINHMCKIFCLLDNFEIFVLNAHVPRSESVNIIQEGDIIRVEEVANQPDLSDTVLHKKSRNTHNEIALDDIILSPSEKKRKAHKFEKAIGNGKLSDEHVSESLDSYVTLTSEPRKKKKKPVKDSHIGSLETTCDAQEMKNESRKGKKKKKATEYPKESLISDYCEKILCSERSNLDTTSVSISEILNESERVYESTPIAKNNQLTTGLHENNSVENSLNPANMISNCNAEELLTHSSHLIKSTGSSKVSSDPLCETNDFSIGPGSVIKRCRPRKRRKPKRREHKNTSTLSVSKIVCKALHSWGASVSPKIKRDVASNNHIRFSDEDRGKVVDIILEENESKNMGIVVGDSLEDNTAETVAEITNKFSKETDSISVDYNTGRQMHQVIEKNSVIGGIVISENDMNCEAVVKESEFGSMSNNDSSVLATVASSEDPLSKLGPSPNVILPQSKRNRRNVIIAKGLGSTLSQLLKESKKSNKEEGIPQKSNPNESYQTLNKPPDLKLKPKKTEKDKRYGGFPVLEKFPRKGDILAFKVLKLNERYEPTISGYLEGKIMDCEEANTLVTITILGGEDELKKINGKFDLEEEEGDRAAESEEKNNQETLQLKWNELIEPRLVFP